MAILADPSRRYSEIYGDGTVANRDCLLGAERKEIAKIWEEGEGLYDRRNLKMGEKINPSSRRSNEKCLLHRCSFNVSH